MAEPKPATGIDALVDEILGTMAGLRDQLRAEMIAQIADVKNELVTIKATHAGMKAVVDNWKYCGVWREDQDYFPGNHVTFNDSEWVCKVGTVGERPNSGSGRFQLCVKGKHQR